MVQHQPRALFGALCVVGEAMKQPQAETERTEAGANEAPAEALRGLSRERLVSFGPDGKRRRPTAKGLH